MRRRTRGATDDWTCKGVQAGGSPERRDLSSTSDYLEQAFHLPVVFFLFLAATATQVAPLVLFCGLTWSANACSQRFRPGNKRFRSFLSKN